MVMKKNILGMGGEEARLCSNHNSLAFFLASPTLLAWFVSANYLTVVNERKGKGGGFCVDHHTTISAASPRGLADLPCPKKQKLKSSKRPS